MALNENGPFPLRAEDDVTDRCPHCRAVLTGSGSVEVTGVELGKEIYDGIMYWVCGGCSLAWSRWGGDGEMTRDAVAAVIQHNDRVRVEQPLVERAVLASTAVLEAALGSTYAPVAWRYDATGGSVIVAVRSDADPSWEDHEQAEQRLTAALGRRVWMRRVGVHDGWRGEMYDESALYGTQPWPGGDR